MKTKFQFVYSLCKALARFIQVNLSASRASYKMLLMIQKPGTIILFSFDKIIYKKKKKKKEKEKETHVALTKKS
jgi:hypothetical protein